MNIEKTVLIDGIIEYTKDNKLKWIEKFSTNDLSRHESHVEISKNKHLILDMHIFDNVKNTNIYIYFYNPKSLQKTKFKSLYYKDSNRFDEIINLVKNV